jgi:hypothetical protein
MDMVVVKAVKQAVEEEVVCVAFVVELGHVGIAVL